MAFQPVPTYADPVEVDEKTGKSAFNPTWLSWFLELSTGGLSGTIQHNELQGLQGGMSGQYYHLTSAQLAATPFRHSSTAPSTLTPPASPYTYSNGDGFDEDLIVQGGTVSLIEFGRGALFIPIGLTAGMFHLSPSDSLRITYSSVPAVTKVPR